MSVVALATDEKPNIEAAATGITVDAGEKQDKEAAPFASPNHCLTGEKSFKFSFPALQRSQIRYFTAVSLIYLGIFCALTVFNVIFSIISLKTTFYANEHMARTIIVLGALLMVRLLFSITTKSIYPPTPLIIIPVVLDATILVSFIVISVFDYVELGEMAAHQHAIDHDGSCYCYYTHSYIGYNAATWLAFGWTTMFWLLGSPVIGYLVIHSSMIPHIRLLCINIYRQLEDFTLQRFVFEDETITVLHGRRLRCNITTVALPTDEKPNIQAAATGITVDAGEKQDKEAAPFASLNHCLTDDESFKFRFPTQRRSQVRFFIVASMIYLGIFCALTVLMVIFSIILKLIGFGDNASHHMTHATIAFGIFLVVRLLFSAKTESIYPPSPLIVVPILLDAAMLVTFIVISVFDYIQLVDKVKGQSHNHGSAGLAIWFGLAWTAPFWLLGAPVAGYLLSHSDMIWYTRNFRVNLYRKIENFAPQTFVFEDETTQPASPTQPMPAN